MKYKKTDIAKFVIPSLLGVFLFMTPIPEDDSITIPIAILSNWLKDTLNHYLVIIIFSLTTISALAALYVKLFKPKFVFKNQFLNLLFNVNPVWLIIRLIAFFYMTIILLSYSGVSFSIIEPLTKIIYSENTGGLILTGLLPLLFAIFFFAGLFLPLLLDFGLLEFIGSLVVKVMRPIFGLPGRAAIDCIASWLGDGTIGILLTSRQYEEGFYTEREAVVIGTTFSLVSITFSLVIINTVGLGHLFIPFYAVVTLSSLIAAIIMPKLPPLSLRPDILYDGSLPNDDEPKQANGNIVRLALDLAIQKARSQDLFQSICIDGVKNVLDMWLGVIPCIMAVGTTALILAEFTPLFKILGLPFIPFLKFLKVPESLAASQTLVAGFADMLLPSLLATQIDSDLTRFIIASVSVTQLIYLSEVGALLLGSKIPITIWELFIIFIERTLISLPIITCLAHLIF